MDATANLQTVDNPTTSALFTTFVNSLDFGPYDMAKLKQQARQADADPFWKAHLGAFKNEEEIKLLLVSTKTTSGRKRLRAFRIMCEQVQLQNVLDQIEHADESVVALFQ